MRPGDHPDFFRRPAPEGRSRESSIRLDADGRFWHEGELVEHHGLAAGMHAWITRHPDDGRYVLENGWDWTYFTVEDAPFVVRTIREADGGFVLALSDGSEVPWDPRRTRVGAGDALYAEVKAGAPRGPFEAKFSRAAQAALARWIEPTADGGPGIRLAGEVVPIGKT